MKKFILMMAFLICASSISLVASDTSDAKRNLKSAQKELASVTSKRDKAQQKQNQLQADYEEALAKVEANQDKPKSLAYKDAVKKSEALPDKLEQNAQLLASLNRQVDSLQNIVSGCEAALVQAQHEEAAEDRSQVNTDVEESAKEETIELPESLQPVDQSADKRDDKTKEHVTAAESGKEKSSNSDGDSSLSPFWTWVIMIGGGILFIWFFWISFKRSSRCPKCGRWFSYEKDGVKILHKERSRGGSGWEIVYEKKFRCRHCGHTRVEKGNLLTSKPTLPSSWY